MTIFDEVIQHNRYHAEAYRHIGDLYSGREQHDFALRAYRQALESEPDNLGALSGIGWTYLYLGHDVRAANSFTQAVRLSPSDPTLYDGLGRSLTRIGRAEKAVLIFDRAIELIEREMPSSTRVVASVLCGRGHAYLALEQPTDAVEDYEYATDVDRRYGEPEMGKGDVLFYNERYHNAIAAYERAIHLRWERPALYLRLGQAYMYVNYAKKAEHALQQAIALDPYNAAAFSSLGDLYREEANFVAATKAYKRALALDPQRAEAYGGVADIFHEQRESEKAMAFYKKAIELNPNDGISRGRLAGLYRKQGWQEDYARECQAARQLISEENHYNRACIEAISGNTDEAIRLLRHALHEQATRPEWIARDPDFDFIRADPRFSLLVGHAAPS